MIMETEVYYDQNGIVVERSTPADAMYIATHMRLEDAQEIWASHHFTPEQAMEFTIQKTIFCLTVRIKDRPVVMFGVNGESVLGDRGVVWMLATDEIENIKFRFVRHSRKFIEMMLDFYPFIYNNVDARNTVSIHWLRMIGANIEKEKPFGIEQRPFHYFYFKKG